MPFCIASCSRIARYSKSCRSMPFCAVLWAYEDDETVSVVFKQEKRGGFLFPAPFVALSVHLFVVFVQVHARHGDTDG